MRGLMQDDQLLLTRLLDRAIAFYPRQQIVTRTPIGDHRETYEELGERAARLANALKGLGIGPGDRVGSFGFNTYRHLELYFAVPCMGSVLHTLNIRLHPDQVAWIANHAEDRVIFVDDVLVPVFSKIAPHLKGVEHVVVMGPGDRGDLGDALDYEKMLDAASPIFDWPALDEDTASAMCYTSGTTGDPKGVVYSHRSMVLHSYMINLAETVGITTRDAVLPVVPMFHANAWGMPYAATLAGAKQVFAGHLSADPAALADLIEQERVSVLAGVPTVWIGLLQHLEQNPRDVSSIRYITAGGAAVPLSLIERFQRQLGVNLIQGWGMTETGPVAALSWLTPELEQLPEEEQFRQRARQGRVVPGVWFRVVAEDGTEVPWDTKSMGEIQVKGNWVAATYYNDPQADERFVDGWLRTGDVAVVDEHGYLQMVDRTKDLVKSGGEWISSVELESALMGHPAVLEAAVIGVPNERWDERPVACV
ncbi:MAG TPA: long-chain fatty acid--CoA ligase, partial [Actinomycetota bacterium]|nr:long-chain fatty acid--CoA ligase [Actinomycetota bacterium]